MNKLPSTYPMSTRQALALALLAIERLADVPMAYEERRDFQIAKGIITELLEKERVKSEIA